MRIAHYMTDIWAQGGIATYIRRVAELQRARGNDVRFFDLHAPSGTVTPDFAPNIVSDPSDLYRQARRLGINIIHLHTEISAPPPEGIAVIRTVHGHQPYCPSGSQYLHAARMPCTHTMNAIGCTKGHLVGRCGSLRLHKLMDEIRRSRHEWKTLRTMPVIAVSKFIRQRMLDAGYPATGIDVLYPISPSVQNVLPVSDDELPRFLFVGRISPQKGTDWLIRSMARTAVPLHLDVVGAGPAEASVRQLAQQLGIGKRITFHGWVSPARVGELLRSARALVFPSMWHEPAGIAVLEAMAYGRPVIVSRVGGAPEMIEDGIEGLLVEPGDETALASALERLAHDWALADVLGRAGKKKASLRFAETPHMEALRGLYAGALEVAK